MAAKWRDYVARPTRSRVAKAVLVASLTPNMAVKTENNPAGQPGEWFEATQAGIAGNRSEFYRVVPEGQFYGYNRPGATPSEAVIANWWAPGYGRQRPGPYRDDVLWLEDCSEDLQKITVPVTWSAHGDDDQIVPFAQFGAGGRRPAHEQDALKTYAGYPHGMLTTHADVLSPDLLAFIQS